MVTNDATLVRLKHSIMEKVAGLAWEDNLNEESMNNLSLEISPGPVATYRCCVYKEREVSKQRIRLSLGLNPDPDSDSKNIVQVNRPACEECPLASYTVTDNCRLCMGKACINSCRFGAISIGDRRTRIDPSKCKECGMCANACPYGAIAHLVRPCKRACPVGAITYDEFGICNIDESKCIQCGHCIHSCPFGAIGSKTYLVDIIRHIKAGDEVIAMVAPATEGQFGPDITMLSIKNAFLEMGFADMVEVGLGGDMTAAYESLEWTEAFHEGKKMTTSCCPAFINMQRQHFPKVFQENVSSIVSPMCAISRYLKKTHPGCITVFLGPCIAKKSEAADPTIPDNADYVITYGEFRALMRSKGVEVKPADNSYQESSVWGKRFATSGGVAKAVLECMEERGEDVSGIKFVQVAGGDACKKTLTLLKNGRLPEEFVEGMICEGGCVGGPSRHRTEMEIKRAREGLIKQADNRGVLENLKDYPMDIFSMYRDGHMDEEPLLK